MTRRESIEVAELLARLATMEQEAAANVSNASELSQDAYGQSRFSAGELTALKGFQNMVRELADWPVEHRH